MRKFLLAGAMLMPIFSLAAPPGVIALRTYGSVDCGEWTQQNLNSNKAWLLGFLSGLNADYSAHKNALAQLTSADQAISWVNNYCRANPLNSVVEAAYLLMKELKQRK